MHEYHYCNRPGDCPHLRYEDWPKGAKVARCMNPEHGDWCGRVVDYSGIGEFVRVIRPSWCHGCDGEGHLLPKGGETIPQSAALTALRPRSQA